MIATLNFTIAAKVANTLLPYIKESFKWNPQVSRRKYAHEAGLTQTASQKDEGTKGKTRAEEVVAPLSAIPENITDYASYLENLSKK